MYFTCTHTNIFFYSILFRPFYRTEQLIVTRPHNTTQVRHQNPGTIITYTNFTSLFDKQFLHDVSMIILVNLESNDIVEKTC